MRRLVCIGCGLAEDMDNPTGDIHPVKLIDLADTTYSENEASRPDKPVVEDLCRACRKKVRQQFFGEADGTLLDMPLMKGA
jgi:hypothetical protein